MLIVMSIIGAMLISAIIMDCMEWFEPKYIPPKDESIKLDVTIFTDSPTLVPIDLD